MTMTESECYRAKAAQCQRLARMMTDPTAAEELLRLGAEYAARAGAADGRKLVAEVAVEIGRDPH
jgi:hypothetical protein